MSPLQSFEELRFVIELLAGELIFCVPFAKKTKISRSMLVIGFLFLCLVSQLYPLMENYALKEQVGKSVIYPVALGWYIFLVLLSAGYILCCFKITVCDTLYMVIAGYTVQHMIYVVVHELIGKVLWPGLRQHLAWYLAISLAVCIPFYMVVFLFFRGSLAECEGELYRNTKMNITFLCGFLLVLMIGTFGCQAIVELVEGNIRIMGAAIDFIFCTLVLFAYISTMRITMLNREKGIVHQLLYERRKQYEIAKGNFDIINQKCHDLKHQICALKKVDAAQRDSYIREVENAVMIIDTFAKTENEVLNTILTDKGLSCEKMNIRLTYVTDGKNMDFISDIDLYALLGNALDNAIECVSRYPEEEKRIIMLRIGVHGGFLSIRTDNYFEGRIELNKYGLPMTSKQNHAYHGFGMKSMKYLTRKYGGTMVIHQGDNLFTLEFLIPMPQTAPEGKERGDDGNSL